ncbi:MAG: type II toxin-antitoxin system RelE/ParE family toxin [Planctomycetota bacterium]
MRIRINPAAEQDLLEAQAWYNLQLSGLGGKFRAAAVASIRRVAEHPESAPVCFADFRRVKLRKFPYCFYYTIESDVIVVFAVVHQHRDPDAVRRQLNS